MNAVKARQWSFARSNGGFCLRRTDRFRSILLPFSAFPTAPVLSNYPRFHFSRFSAHKTRLTHGLRYPLSIIFSFAPLPWSDYSKLFPSTLVRWDERARLPGGSERILFPSALVAQSFASFALTPPAHFIFGLNFIAKLFHNQNFMLTPPLSSAGALALFAFCFYGRN